MEAGGGVCGGGGEGWTLMRLERFPVHPPPETHTLKPLTVEDG